MSSTISRPRSERRPLGAADGGWPQRRIGDLLTYERPDRYIVQSTDYLEIGDTPVLTANKSFILGYTHETFGIVRNVPAIIFDDFTTECKYVTFPFKVKSSAIKILRAKHDGVDLRYVFELMQTIKFSASDHKRYYISEYQDIEIPLPSYDQQQATMEILSDLDGSLHCLDRVIAKKGAIKNAALQQLASGRIRLPGFRDKWKTQRLGDVGCCIRGVSYDPLTDLAHNERDTTVRLLRSNNVQDAAIVLTDVQYVSSGRVAESQKMKHGDILICMANGSKYLVGKSGLFICPDGGVYTFGAFMGCFRMDPDCDYSSRFVFYLLQTPAFRGYVSLTLSGSSINNLRPRDIETATFEFPDKHEQAAIATVLSDMDAEIRALELRRDKVLSIKRGMMQQILIGRAMMGKPADKTGGRGAS